MGTSGGQFFDRVDRLTAAARIITGEFTLFVSREVPDTSVGYVQQLRITASSDRDGVAGRHGLNDGLFYRLPFGLVFGACSAAVRCPRAIPFSFEAPLVFKKELRVAAIAHQFAKGSLTEVINENIFGAE